MVKVMIADDNIDLNSMYCKFLTNDKSIEVVSSTTDGETTLDEYLKHKPDLLLLDLDMPKINGLEIINKLSYDTTEKSKCNIIVISGSTEMRFHLLNTAKVYRIIPKPTSPQHVLDVIKEFDKENSISEVLSTKKISDLLIDLNIQPYSKNYDYLIDSILIAYKKPFVLRNIKLLYEEIGRKNNVSPTQVKWIIRNSINVMNKYITQDMLSSIFHIRDNRILTPKYFFTMLIQYFENNIKTEGI